MSLGGRPHPEWISIVLIITMIGAIMAPELSQGQYVAALVKLVVLLLIVFLYSYIMWRRRQHRQEKKDEH